MSGIVVKCPTCKTDLICTPEDASKLRATPPGLETVPEGTMAALASLVDRLHLIHDDERYLSVWQVSQAHLGPYNGPQYTEELSNADAILTRHRSTQDGK
jgi:hypothetical protein